MAFKSSRLEISPRRSHGCCLKAGNSAGEASISQQEVKPGRHRDLHKSPKCLPSWDCGTKRERPLQGKCRLRSLWGAKGALSGCGKGVWHLSDSVLLTWVQSHQRSIPQSHGELARPSSGQSQNGKVSL